jgi:hypothetical protein
VITSPGHRGGPCVASFWPIPVRRLSRGGCRSVLPMSWSVPGGPPEALPSGGAPDLGAPRKRQTPQFWHSMDGRQKGSGGYEEARRGGKRHSRRFCRRGASPERGVSRGKCCPLTLLPGGGRARMSALLRAIGRCFSALLLGSANTRWGEGRDHARKGQAPINGRQGKAHVPITPGVPRPRHIITRFSAPFCEVAPISPFSFGHPHRSFWRSPG